MKVAILRKRVSDGGCAATDEKTQLLGAGRLREASRRRQVRARGPELNSEVPEHWVDSWGAVRKPLGPSGCAPVPAMQTRRKLGCCMRLPKVT